jgi:hypothetical protein
MVRPHYLHSSLCSCGSSKKFFGPHAGALDYFEWVGNEFGGEHIQGWKDDGHSGRRLLYKQTMSAIREYEFE